MSQTSALLAKISALRQRIEQAQGLASEAGSAVEALFADPSADPLAALEHQSAIQTAQHDNLDRSLNLFGVETNSVDATPLPTRLTLRGRRILELVKDLLERLRPLGEALERSAVSEEISKSYREAAAMTDMALRVIQRFPDSAQVQLHFCEGLEPLLGYVRQQVERIGVQLMRRRRRQNQKSTLREILIALHARKPVDVRSLGALAEEILEEARGQEPLEFDESPDPEELLAGHSLNVARVMARIIRSHPDWRQRPLDPLLAALVHDVGMLDVPEEILLRTEPLDDEARREIESHAFLGGRMVSRLVPDGAWLVEAVESHHERLDGTGYPSGKQEGQVSRLTCFLAICDVYAAMRVARPHRPSRESRTAMTDTLLLADRGQLDRQAAEWLLGLSFYPVGSIVELNDGSLAKVVATPTNKGDLQAPARPVVILLTNAKGQRLPESTYLDLGQADHTAIVCSLNDKERLRLARSGIAEAA